MSFIFNEIIFRLHEKKIIQKKARKFDPTNPIAEI